MLEMPFQILKSFNIFRGACPSSPSWVAGPRRDPCFGVVLPRTRVIEYATAHEGPYDLRRQPQRRRSLKRDVNFSIKKAGFINYRIWYLKLVLRTWKCLRWRCLQNIVVSPYLNARHAGFRLMQMIEGWTLCTWNVQYMYSDRSCH